MESSRRGPRTAVLVAAILLAIAGVVGIVWWLGGDEPEAVDAGRALDQDRVQDPGVLEAEERAEEEDPAPVADGPPTTPEQLTGTWVVDTSRPFDRAAGQGTFVGYRIEEELANIGTQTAIGRSPAVDGMVRFDGTRIVEVEVTADLTLLESDDGRRDDRVASMLGPDASATFVLDDAIDLGEVPRVEEVIELDTGGRLAIRDVEREVEVEIQAVVTEMGLLVTGSTEILLEDFDVQVPSAAIVLSASDTATIEWQLFLRRQ